MERIETVVIGGGQAGLSASWHLKALGREHVVLDRGRIGDTWRNRWDSFCLVSPNRMCRLPGFPYDGDDPDGFMLRDEIVSYVERFAQGFGPPIRNGVEVTRLSRDGEAFRAETTSGDIEARNIIVAAGTHQYPRIPEWDAELPDGLNRIHSSEYRKAEDLPPGGVLVVGSGQSGCQIAEDLMFAGRETWVAVGNAGRIPRRYRGRDIFDWDEALGLFDLPVQQMPLGTATRFRAHPHLSGRDGGRTIDLRRMALDGAHLTGKVTGAEGGRLMLDDGLAERLDRIDADCREWLDEIDAFIALQALDVPEEDASPADWTPPPQDRTLDLAGAGITTVLYATGFRRDFGWIDIPVFDGTGYPVYDRGVTGVPGLFFLGLHWMHTQGSGLFHSVGHDAEYVVSKIS